MHLLVGLLLLYSFGILSATLTNIIQNRGKFRIDELLILQWLFCLLMGYLTLVFVRLVMKIWFLEDQLDISTARSHGIAIGVRTMTATNLGSSDVGRVRFRMMELVDTAGQNQPRSGTLVTEVTVNIGHTER
ncbi:hypothetical protein HK098_008149 [Nowakowskiella sp. JEL0407]|nr:hypothetical protein HK098_008149 [Nowakowskiella sp. JEL0407]